MTPTLFQLPSLIFMHYRFRLNVRVARGVEFSSRLLRYPSIVQQACLPMRSTETIVCAGDGMSGAAVPHWYDDTTLSIITD